jgi:hypothetical protein
MPDTPSAFWYQICTYLVRNDNSCSIQRLLCIYQSLVTGHAAYTDRHGYTGDGTLFYNCEWIKVHDVITTSPWQN